MLKYQDTPVTGVSLSIRRNGFNEGSQQRKMTMSVEQTPSGRPAEAPGCRASESLEIDAIVDCAYEAARLLKLLANEKRLVILCFLATRGEMPVGPWSRPLGSASRRCRSIWPNCAATDSFSFAASPRPCIIGSPIRALCACLACSKRSFARGLREARRLHEA